MLVSKALEVVWIVAWKMGCDLVLPSAQVIRVKSNRVRTKVSLLSLGDQTTSKTHYVTIIMLLVLGVIIFLITLWIVYYSKNRKAQRNHVVRWDADKLCEI